MHAPSCLICHLQSQIQKRYMVLQCLLCSIFWFWWCICTKDTKKVVVTTHWPNIWQNKRYLNDIIQMCQLGRGPQISLQTDANSPPLYPENILPYVVHSLAHHPAFPNIDECRDVKLFESLYRYFEITLTSFTDSWGPNEVYSDWKINNQSL